MLRSPLAPGYEGNVAGVITDWNNYYTNHLLYHQQGPRWQNYFPSGGAHIVLYCRNASYLQFY